MTDHIGDGVDEYIDQRTRLIESQIAEFLAEPDRPPYCALYVRDGLELAPFGAGQNPPRFTYSCTTHRLRGQREDDIRRQARELGGPGELILLRGEWTNDPWPELDPPQQTPLREESLLRACGLKPTHASCHSVIVRDETPRVWRWDAE